MRKDGYFGGWVAHRYATKPKPRHVRIYAGQQRERIVHRLFEIMRGWNLSPFELEGTMRASVRSTLCLAGHGWDQSDQESQLLVVESLGRMRAVRPTWDQGQPEYAIPRENCNRCGAAIPEEFQVGGRHHRFCSDVCAKSAIEQRAYEGRKKESAAYRAAWNVILRTKSPLIDCKHCQKPYRPTLGVPSVYCSRECSAAARVVVPDRTCRVCEKTFRSHAGNHPERGFCCSRECDAAYRRTIRIEKVCQCCGQAYFAKSPQGLYCSNACSLIVQRFRTGRNLPKRLAPHVFDYLFKMAA